MTDGDELKRCPFCGSRKTRLEIEVHGFAEPGNSRVVCRECGGCGPWGGTRAGAAEAWDHRWRGDGRTDG